MMRRETAYRLAGRKHRAHDTSGDDTWRRREIRFHTLPADQAKRAAEVLTQVAGIKVEPGDRSYALKVSYSLSAHSLEDIEAHLGDLGFRFDKSLFNRIFRAVVHFCEDTQRRNMVAPQRLIKKSNEVYMKAYEHHAHGDHDDTPAELREYK